MSRRGRMVIVIVALAVAVAAFWFLQRGTAEREFATAALGSIDVTIQTVGSVQATGATAVRADVGGVIEQMGVEAGDVVAEGDIVAVLDRQPFDDAVAAANERVVESEYGLQFAEDRASENDADVALRADVLEAAERVQQARAALEDAVTKLSRSVVIAPASGTIIEIQMRVGDAVGAGQSIARLSTPDDFRLIADIDELDLPNVGIGADARFRLDSYPASEIDGVVVTTAPQARQQGGATVFATTIEFDVPADLDIRPGMNADVTIVTDERDDVLLIPERALTTIGDRVYVDVSVDGTLEQRELTLGYRGNGQVEVVDGLEAGDRVLLR